MSNTSPSTAPLLSVVRRLANVAIGAFATGRSGGIDLHAYRTSIWVRLQEDGLATRMGRLRAGEASRHLNAFLEQLATLPDWQAPTPTERVAYAQIHSAIHHPGRGHVLHPLALIASLFETWDAFLAICPSDEASPRGVSDVVGPDGTDIARSLFLDMIFKQGRSISSAAVSLDVHVSTAQGWAAAAGYEPPKRPSKLRGRDLDLAVESLKRGAEISQVASGAGVSDVSVRRLLRTTVGLHDAWERARNEKTRTEARSCWQSALQLESVVGPGAARALEPRAYAWLYRNDREWLLATNSGEHAPRIGNNARVNWDRRDNELSSACQRAALELHECAPASRVTLAEVFKLVPEVRTKMCHLDRLPLTARALRSIMKARP
jgi:hypothetical protein